MKSRGLCLMLVVLMMFSLMPISAEASVASILSGMGEKIEKGATNALTGFVEVPMKTFRGADHGMKGIDNKPLSRSVGTAYGVIGGVGYGAGRTVSGLKDLAGFWAIDYPTNAGYGQMLDKKDAWQEESQAAYARPEVMDGMVKPDLDRGMRGMENVSFSVMELPYQTYLATRDESNPGLGIIRGTSYGLSRLYIGAMDMATFYLPQPKDTVGSTFESENPWKGFMKK